LEAAAILATDDAARNTSAANASAIATLNQMPLRYGRLNYEEPMSKMAPIHGLHHFAYRCRDAEETRHFYEDLLGLPLVHVIRADRVPSTGEEFPYVHLFFQMKDGSYIAFFDLGDGTASLPSPNTPAWVNHLALRMSSVEEVTEAKKRLEAANIKVVGVTDHGFVQSIYFFDPNGIRLELTTETLTDAEAAEFKTTAHEALAAWTAESTGRLNRPANA
jgi:catechol 2,3-dioxygenase-like lactoylglutathione lyase family enzyme